VSIPIESNPNKHPADIDRLVELDLARKMPLESDYSEEQGVCPDCYGRKPFSWAMIVPVCPRCELTRRFRNVRTQTGRPW